MAATSRPAALVLFELRFECGGVTGRSHIFAPDRRAAVRLLSEHPSMFGLEHERVLIFRVTPLAVRKDAPGPRDRRKIFRSKNHLRRLLSPAVRSAVESGHALLGLLAGGAAVGLAFVP